VEDSSTFATDDDDAAAAAADDDADAEMPGTDAIPDPDATEFDTELAAGVTGASLPPTKKREPHKIVAPAMKRTALTVRHCEREEFLERRTGVTALADL